MNADSRVGIHVGLHGLQFEVTHVHHTGVVEFERLLNATAAQESVGAAWVAHDHGEVAVVDAVEAHLEVALGLVGDIVLTVVRWIVVAVGINAKQGKVSRVTRPHPVVCVTTELSDAFWRIAHEPDVAEVAVDEEVELIGVVKGLHLGSEIGADALFLLFDLSNDRLNGLLAGALVHVVRDVGKHALGHIFNALEEGHAEIRNRLLFFQAHGPESVGEDVVLYCAEPLNGAIGTVVVGEHEAFTGNQFGCAAASIERGDGILQTRLVEGVNVFCRKVEAHLLHLGLVDALEHVQQPHAFIGFGWNGGELKGCKKQQENAVLHEFESFRNGQKLPCASGENRAGIQCSEGIQSVVDIRLSSAV